MEKQFPIKGWRMIFYVWGWLSGALSPLFWIIMAGLHQMKNFGDPFFGDYFHIRVYWYGVVTASITGIVYLWFFIYLYNIDYTIPVI